MIDTLVYNANEDLSLRPKQYVGLGTHNSQLVHQKSCSLVCSNCSIPALDQTQAI